MDWDRIKKELSGKMTLRQKVKRLLVLDVETRKFTSHEDERIASFLESQRCITYRKIQQEKRRHGPRRIAG